MHTYMHLHMYVAALLVYIRTYKTAWHKNLMVIKFHDQPKLLTERKLTRL